MTINSCVIEFKNFIELNWKYINEVSQRCIESTSAIEGDIVPNWLQANWETIIEYPIFFDKPIFLLPYGFGADIIGIDGDRIINPSIDATHEVFCYSDEPILDIMTKKKIDPSLLTFDRFVNWDGQWYIDSPPFNYVLLNNGETDNYESIVSVTDIIFDIRELKD